MSSDQRYFRPTRSALSFRLIRLMGTFFSSPPQYGHLWVLSNPPPTGLADV